MLYPPLFFLLTAMPAFALSCTPYSARHAFQDASAATERYIIAHGQLDFNPGDLPRAEIGSQNLPSSDTIFRATLTGFSLTATGFDARFVRQIWVNVQCSGPWCGALNAGQDYMVFLKQDGSDYLLTTGACGGFAFAEPSTDMLHDIHQCLLGEACDPPQY